MKQRLILIFTLFIFTSCGGSGGDSGNNQPTPPPPPPDPVGLDGAGGMIEVTDPSSPIFGAKVVVDSGAIGEGSVIIEIDYEDGLPGDLHPAAQTEDYVILGKTIVLTKNVEGTFEKPVKVTVPYDASTLGVGDVPSVLFWNETGQSYEAVTVTAYDPNAGTVTFRTAHFSKFIVIAIRGLAQLFSSSTTYINSFEVGYLPSEDGFFRSNVQSYSDPGGSCLGMASYSQWFFVNAKDALNQSTGLRNTYLEGDPSRTSDDLIVQELIVRAHAAAAPTWAAILGYVRAQGEQIFGFEAGVSLAQLMLLTQQPQLFLWWGDNGEGGHALVAYGWDLSTTSFKLYDPNFPLSDEITVKFDKDGFGQASNAAAYSNPPKTFGYASLSDVYAPSSMQALYDGAEQGWTDGQFGKINLSDPILDGNNVATVATIDNVMLSGEITLATVVDAGPAPTAIDVYVAGSYDGTTSITENRFSYTIDQLPNPSLSEVALVAYKPGVLNGQKSIYGTFKRFEARVGELATDNFGFERGSFENWLSERHTTRSDASVIPSDKSGIASGGFDPIANDIPTVLFGDYSARVNNSDPNFHVSTISRDIVVPSDAQTFRLPFSWAAILEDPNHTPEDQPYIEVTVTNKTQGIDLYRRRFFSNDPAYTDWRSYENGRWKAINWQAVMLDDLAQYAGDTISVHVEAADCDRGAHGGYLYFDAEE